MYTVGMFWSYCRYVYMSYSNYKLNNGAACLWKKVCCLGYHRDLPECETETDLVSNSLEGRLN